MTGPIVHQLCYAAGITMLYYLAAEVKVWQGESTLLGESLHLCAAIISFSKPPATHDTLGPDDLKQTPTAIAPRMQRTAAVEPEAESLRRRHAEAWRRHL